MLTDNPIQTLIKQRKSGEKVGICSICSVNEFVIETAIKCAVEFGLELLVIEATANQVNQYGGYSGLRPSDFREIVFRLADQYGYSRNKIILGGDHLGPFPWKALDEKDAMERSRCLIDEYVRAGFRKIHIDTSTPVKNDKGKVDVYTIAERTAFLCKIAEDVYKNEEKEGRNAIPPVYIVGSDVPTPGGKMEKDCMITEPEKLQRDIKVFYEVFKKYNIENVWERVIAIVVNIGIEFEHDSIYQYNKEKAKELSNVLIEYPNLVIEAHSTDYQPPEVLNQMIEDGIAILKVGPALTFALREALVALSFIEEELWRGREEIVLSNFRSVLKNEMLQKPVYWINYFKKDIPHFETNLIYSYYDRTRYYLNEFIVQQSINRLIENLEKCDIPLPLLSQFMESQYLKVRKGLIPKKPRELIIDRIKDYLLPYIDATRGRDSSEF